MRILVKEKLSEHKYKTPEGYLICVDSILARTGKQEYKKNEIFTDSKDDSIIEVDRPYEEVFNEKTIASFENKPFVNEHPDEDVTLANYKDYAVGFIRDVHEGEKDGQPVLLGTIVITDEETIDDIESGRKKELSCGYDCEIVDEKNPTQRNIRGNHVALCECGRAGIARIQDSKVEDVNIQNRKTRLLKTFKQYNYNRDDAIAEVNNIRNITEDEIAELTDWIYKIYKDFNTLKDSVNSYSTAEIKEAARKLHAQKPYLSIQECYEIVKKNIKNGGYLLDSVEDDFYDELFSSNLKYEFIKGGYGIKFKTPRDYQKAKEIAKRTRYTKGKWYDKDLEFFEYGGITISNEDSINDAGTTRRMFRESEVGDENSWFGTTEWGTPKGNMYIYKKNEKIIAEGSSTGWSGNALEKGEKKEFNSVKELNRWLNTPMKDSIKDWEKKDFSYKDFDIYKVGTSNDNMHYEVRYNNKTLYTYDENEYNEIKRDIDKIKIEHVTKYGITTLKKWKMSYGKAKPEKIFTNLQEAIEKKQILENTDGIAYHIFKISTKTYINGKLIDSMEENMKDKLQNKQVKIRIKFDSNKEANDALKMLHKKEDFMNSNLIFDDTVEVITTDINVDKLKKDLKMYFVEKFEVNDSINDSLIPVSDKYINELKNDIQKIGFKVVSVNKYDGNVHFQILSNKGDMTEFDLKNYARQLNQIDDKFDKYNIPMTYNIGLQYDGYISAGLDLRKQWIKDSIKDYDLSNKEESQEELDKWYDKLNILFEDYENPRMDKKRVLNQIQKVDGEIKKIIKIAKSYGFKLDTMDYSLPKLKDSVKDEAIYKWMADPEDEQDLIDEAEKLGCQLQKIGSLIQVTGSISKLAKVLGETEESIIKASQQRMSTIKKVKDVDTYKEVTKETKTLDSVNVLKLINITKKAKVVKDSKIKDVDQRVYAQLEKIVEEAIELDKKRDKVLVQMKKTPDIFGLDKDGHFIDKNKFIFNGMVKAIIKQYEDILKRWNAIVETNNFLKNEFRIRHIEEGIDAWYLPGLPNRFTLRSLKGFQSK